jgi:SAM-dependent methyltransferase
MAVTSDSEVLARHLAVDGRDVADVGCGAGGFASALAYRGARVTGIEISEEQLAPARARTLQDGMQVNFAVGRAEDLPLADASQDVVVFMRSLHHVEVERLDDALREARRVLRPGGAVWVAEPVAEGDFFAMVSLIEDETEVRAAARAAIESAAGHGLRHEASERYEVGGVYKDLDAFRAHMVQVDPARAPIFDRCRDELAVRFASGGEPFDDEGARSFTQVQRADLLRAV